MSTDYFTREFSINSLDITLKLEQKFEGDVGCVVWDASIVLAKYLEILYKKNPNYFKNVLILELGAGVGCVGLTAACLGANVILTDLPEITPILKRNVRLNKEYVKKNNGRIDVISLPWGTSNLKKKPDIILLADCIYYIQSIEPLICTLRKVCEKNTHIFISQEMRDSEIQQECWRYFLESINKYFKIHTIPLEEQDEEFRSFDIIIMRLSIL